MMAGLEGGVEMESTAGAKYSLYLQDLRPKCRR